MALALSFARTVVFSDHAGGWLRDARPKMPTRIVGHAGLQRLRIPRSPVSLSATNVKASAVST